MFQPQDISRSTTLAQAPSGRLGKRIVFASDDVDGIWRPGDQSVGRWVKPSDVGAGMDSTANKRKFRFRVIDGDDTIEWRKGLREQLAKEPSLALIAGSLNPDLYADLEPHGNHGLSPLLPRRAGSVLVDSPRAWFTADLDGLDLASRGFDAYEHDLELPDILADIWDECGLHWLITDCVIQVSSSHGLFDRTTVRAHIDWHLQEPLTLVEQKALAKYINSKVAAAGISDRIIDESVYDPARLLFTAPAELLRRTWSPSQAVKFEPVEPPYLQRVRLVSRGQGRLGDIPGEAMDELRTAQAIRRVVRPKSKNAFKRTLDSKPILSSAIEPGNIYAPIRARIYKAANETPAHRANATKESLRKSIQSEIEALPDHEDNGLRRMRFISKDEFDRSWHGALEQRYKWRVCKSQSRAYPAAVPIETARSSLSSHMRRAIKKGIEYAHQAKEESSNLAQPKHLLLRSPPGVGKTEATIAAVSVGQLMSERISYLAPSIRLAEEATLRMRARVPGDEYSQSRVRHMQGRSQVCSEPTYDRMASKIESHGISPLKTVCGYCPRKDACPWPLMHGNTDSGFVSGQHAHATTSLAKIKDASSDAAPAVGIVDESMIGTLLRERHPPQKIETLSRWAKRGAIRLKDGERLHMASIDLVSYRSDLVNALSLSKGVLLTRHVLKFSNQVRVKKGDSYVKIPRIDAALSAEVDSARWHQSEVNEAMKDYHAARAAGKSSRSAERRVTQATAQLSIIQWFKTAYTAIKGSLSVPGRNHVFGVRISDSKQITLHIRSELPAVMRDRHWIWLDGTADPEVWSALVRGGSSNISTVERRLDVIPGAYHLTQYPDRAYAKSMFTANSSDARSHISQLHRFILRESLSRKNVLVVTQLPIKQTLQSMGVPENVSLEHYNALRGLDRYKDVECAIIVGRPQPASNTLEVITEALHYDNMDVPSITSANGAFFREQREIAVAGEGRPVAVVNAEGHPDPRVRAMRRQIVDAEVRQAIMRLRLFDRTPDNPAILHVFGQCDTGLIANELRDWKDANVSLVDLLIAKGVVCSCIEVARQVGGSHVEGMSDRHIKNINATAKKLVDWPTYKISISGKSAAQNVKVNSSSKKDAALSLSRLGVDFIEVL